MTWLDACNEILLDGFSINVIGMSGSGRTQSLEMLTESLAESGWTCVRWSSDDLQRHDRSTAKAAIEELQKSEGLAVLLIDDFGDHLASHVDGPWLERMLFSAVHEEPGPTGEFLRCVVVTYPRDREIVGPGSVLRERAKGVSPMPPEPGMTLLQAWGVENAAELDALMGSSTVWSGAGGSTVDQRRGNALKLVSDDLPRLVGQLDGAQQKRLGAILSRQTPARWRSDDVDPYLRPLLVSRLDGAEARCAVPEIVDASTLSRLLVSNRWPEASLGESARRFAARCGNEPSPLWIDNFLSDVNQLDFARFSEFLQRVVALRPPGSRLRLLSRDFVAGVRVSPRDLRGLLEDARLPEQVRERLDWRIYDRRKLTNLHRRELLLPRRGVGFSLPIVTMLVGQAAIGNESDAELDLPETNAAAAAWQSGSVVL